MLNTLRPGARPALRVGMVPCLQAAVLAAAFLVAGGSAASAAAPRETGRDVVGSWIARMEQRATDLETAPSLKATRVGAGPVMKLGDGGMVEVTVPGPVQPSPGDPVSGASAGVVATDGSAAATPVSSTAPAAPVAPAVGEIAAGSLEAGSSGDVIPVLAAPPPPALTARVRARSADRVGRLASRLIELGYLQPDQWTDSFNDTLETAVRAFQIAQGLMPDGKVGEVTRQALDRTPAQAAALIRGAVTAMRAFQPKVPDTVLLVNLPSQTVTYIDHGALQFTMRAVVGRPSRQTPLLQDRVTSVTINPTWTVPHTVLTEDKLPVLRKKGNTGIKNAIVYLDGNPVVPETVNWWSVSPERIKIVQQPGDDNALGRFRFNLTNGDGIFLHGTNDPKLFDRDMRAASSGCVRLADARLVAETLLSAAKVDHAAIDQQLDSGKTKTIALPRSIPVRFVYWTAMVDADGTVRVHPGIYDEVSATGGSPTVIPLSKPTPKMAPKLDVKPVRPLPVRSPAAVPLPPRAVATQPVPVGVKPVEMGRGNTAPDRAAM